MRRPTLLLMLILLFLHTYAQKKMPVEFFSDDRKLCVIPQGGLLITTKAGDVAVTDSLNGYWWEIHPSYAPLGDHVLEQGNFFNRDTGFVSGFICSQGEEYNIIYHTQDGGVSWTEVSFGADGPVDDACNLDNGEAWLSVAGKGIIYTTNYGLSWKRLSNPDQNQLFTHIYFNTKREGFIGSIWNMLALTLDNCSSWKIIPTPLDQKKYNKTNLESRPEINRTAIFKDYLLVKQEELVFYTKRDTIRWTALPDYTDFYTDASNSALFFKLASGGFIKTDSAMQPLFKADINRNCFDASCKNGNLFVMTENEVIQLYPDNTVRSSLILTNENAKVEPEFIGSQLGAIGNNIYKQGSDAPWEYVLTLPFKVDSGRLHALEANRIVYYNEDSVYYYSIANNQVEKKDIREMLREFWKPGIKEITYFKGSIGCYDNNLHSPYYYAEYKKVGKNFKLSHSKPKDRSERILPADLKVIDGTAVENFAKRLPDFYNKRATIADLGFTEADYTKCKKDILKFRDNFEKSEKPKEGEFYLSKNNIDFDRLLSTVDTIKQLDDVALKHLLDNIDEWSDAYLSHVGVSIKNRRNVDIVFFHYSSQANALCLPWTVRIDDPITSMYAMAITRFIRETFPSFLSETDRVKVLHTFVRKLYK